MISRIIKDEISPEQFEQSKNMNMPDDSDPRPCCENSQNAQNIKVDSHIDYQPVYKSNAWKGERIKPLTLNKSEHYSDKRFLKYLSRSTNSAGIEKFNEEASGKNKRFKTQSIFINQSESINDESIVKIDKVYGDRTIEKIAKEQRAESEEPYNEFHAEAPKSSFYENNKKGYPCDKCEKILLSRSSLKLHLRIHTNETPYQCEDCGLTFRWCTSFKNHLKNHKKNLPQCPVAACGRRFSMKERLEMHFQSVHIQMLEPPPLKLENGP